MQSFQWVTFLKISENCINLKITWEDYLFPSGQVKQSIQHGDHMICWVDWGRMTLQGDLQSVPVFLWTSFGKRLGWRDEKGLLWDRPFSSLVVRQLSLPYFQNTIIHLQPEAHRKSLITLLQQRTIPDSLIKAFTSYITLLLEEYIKYGRMWEWGQEITSAKKIRLRRTVVVLIDFITQSVSQTLLSPLCSTMVNTAAIAAITIKKDSISYV